MRKRSVVTPLIVLAGIAILLPVLTVGPGWTLAAYAAIAAVVALLRYPILAVHGFLVATGIGLIPHLVGFDSGLFAWISTALLVIGTIGAVTRRKFWNSRGAVALLVASGIFIMIGALVGATTVSPEVAAQGVRLWINPILAVLIAMTCANGRSGMRLMKTATIIVVVSTVAAAVELAVGMDRILLLTPLEYGEQIRSTGGVFRAPGLFQRHYEFGAFAGVLGALAVLWRPVGERTRGDRAWRALAIAVSVVALVLSWYRGGFVIFLVAVALAILLERDARLIGRKILAVIAVCALFVYLVGVGFTSSESLVERTYVWSRLIQEYPVEFFGYGFGFAGAASQSRFAEVSIFTDNYFLNMLLQVGPVLAVAFFAVLFVVAARMTRRSRTVPALRVGSVIFALLASFVVVEFWEYSAATALMLAVVAAAAAAQPREEPARKAAGRDARSSRSFT